jgi:hypothetical protein
MSVCILPVKGRTGRKFLLEITSENNLYLTVVLL